MLPTALVTIEKQLDALLAQFRQLERENQELRAQAGQWQLERTRLIEKNTMACSRIETMIARLKSLELPSP